ncbi:MAG TPA: nucleotide exchange factor GrpE [Phycisphaerae bacterium]|nr:nucleotide exchange factor GrpE [Phycisphaerae bacterium]
MAEHEKKNRENHKQHEPEAPVNDGARVSESPVDTKAFEAAIAEAEDLRQRLVRWQADFENLRRRSAKEVLDAGRIAEGDFARDLLDVLDHFESALSVDPAKTDAASLLQGVKITYDELKKVLQQRGIQSFDPVGEQFDPHKHEAIAQQPASDKTPGSIIQTLQRGYMFGQKILRPAKVIVAAP